MGFISKFLASYSRNFLAAVMLWPLASAALTLPILAYLYHRDGRLRFASVVSTYLAVLYLMGLGCFTLYPLPTGTSGPGISYGIPWQLNPFAPIGDFMREGISILPQIVFNIVLFMPLGFIAGRLLRWGAARSVIAGLAVSFAIEAAQGTWLFGIYPYAFRTADVDDLIYNTAGAALGWWSAQALARILPPGALAEEGEVTHEPGFVRRSVAFWLDTLIVGIISMLAIGAFAVLAPMTVDLLADAGGSWQLAICAAVFLWIEAVIPWREQGSTPGGRFVRMSCETRERTGAHRAAFIAVRAAVLGASYLFFPIAWPLLALFYLIWRQMPYDLI